MKSLIGNWTPLEIFFCKIRLSIKIQEARLYLKFTTNQQNLIKIKFLCQRDVLVTLSNIQSLQSTIFARKLPHRPLAGPKYACDNIFILFLCNMIYKLYSLTKKRLHGRGFLVSFFFLQNTSGLIASEKQIMALAERRNNFRGTCFLYCSFLITHRLGLKGKCRQIFHHLIGLAFSFRETEVKP